VDVTDQSLSANLGTRSSPLATRHEKKDFISHLLQAGLIVGALAFVLVYLYIAIQRMSYSYELEWMEGGMVDHVRRLRAGLSIYAEPSLEFSPYAYAPIYLWLSAALSALVGEGFLPLRLISFLASLGTFALLFELVWRESQDAVAALLAACLFAATFQLSGFFFDVARVDSLSIFLLILTVSVARRVKTVRGAIGAGALITLTVFTKQAALPVVPAMAMYFVLTERRLAVPFALSVLGIGGVGLWALDTLYEGWASFYLFGFHAGRGTNPRNLLVFLRDMSVLWLAGVCGAIFILSRFRWRKDRREGLFYGAVALSILGAVAYSRSLRLGAYFNVYMPAHAVLALLFGLGFSEIRHSIRNLGERDARWRFASWLFLVACVVEFGSLVYRPSYQIPTPADRQAGDQLVELMAQVEGPVWLVDHGYLPALAGKETSIQYVSIQDAVSNERTRPYVQKAVLEGLRNQKYAAILISMRTHRALTNIFPEMMEALQENYSLTRETIFDDPGVFFPVTGLRLRPTWLYTPR
jgi:4-amino-4-deoxy-L-arabinose transferase-like glycosyltransferase